jgi:hypothetical protein
MVPFLLALSLGVNLPAAGSLAGRPCTVHTDGQRIGYKHTGGGLIIVWVVRLAAAAALNKEYCTAADWLTGWGTICTVDCI